jgi:hypothetical protein
VDIDGTFLFQDDLTQCANDVGKHTKAIVKPADALICTPSLNKALWMHRKAVTAVLNSASCAYISTI